MKPSDPLTIGLAIFERRPSLALAYRIGEAVRLIEAGRVLRQPDGTCAVGCHAYPMKNDINRPFSIRAIHDGIVSESGRRCSCHDFENGIAGWYLPYPPQIELEPGVMVRPCCHILAVYIARQVEAEAATTPIDGLAPEGSPHGALGESGV